MKVDRVKTFNVYDILPLIRGPGNNRKSKKENPKDGWGNSAEIDLGNSNGEPFIIEIK